MRLRRVVLIGISLTMLAVDGTADSLAGWQQHTDKVYWVIFRYPKQWKTNPDVKDSSYFEGSNGSVQIYASDGETPQLACEDQAEHKAQPFGTRPTIRSLTVQGQPACLIWPSKDQVLMDRVRVPHAELVVEYPHPITIRGHSYTQFILYADTDHILRMMRTLRFITSRN